MGKMQFIFRWWTKKKVYKRLYSTIFVKYISPVFDQAHEAVPKSCDTSAQSHQWILEQVLDSELSWQAAQPKIKSTDAWVYNPNKHGTNVWTYKTNV